MASDTVSTIDLDQLDALRRDDSWRRIIRGTSGVNFRSDKILLTVVLWASNAKAHVLESRLQKLARADEEKIVEI